MNTDKFDVQYIELTPPPPPLNAITTLVQGTRLKICTEACDCTSATSK